MGSKREKKNKKVKKCQKNSTKNIKVVKYNCLRMETFLCYILNNMEGDDFMPAYKDKKSGKWYCKFYYKDWTGMRLGELLALSTQDVDFVNQEINIDKTYQRVKGEDVFTSPKTEKSKRRVPIPEFLCQEIQSYIDKQPKEKISKRLFPYNRAYLTNELKKSCQMTGVRRIRVHDIRHSHVSLLINQGFDALVIARRVGHEKVSTTLNTYAHLFPHKQERLVSVLEGLGKENEIILVAK